MTGRHVSGRWAVSVFAAAIVIVGTAGAPHAVRAADDPGGPPIFAAQPKTSATMRTNPATGPLRLGKQSIFFEKTRLAILSQRTGARIGHRTGPGPALSWICLTDTQNGLRVWLTADDDQGDDTITGVTLAKAPGAVPDYRCPSMPGEWRGVTLPHKVRLDMSDDALRAELGAPSFDQAGVIGFVYVQPIARQDNSWVTGASLWVAVDKGKVGVISLSHHSD